MAVLVFAAPLFLGAFILMALATLAVYPLVYPEVKNESESVHYPIGHASYNTRIGE